MTRNAMPQSYCMVQNVTVSKINLCPCAERMGMGGITQIAEGGNSFALPLHIKTICHP